MQKATANAVPHQRIGTAMAFLCTRNMLNLLPEQLGPLNQICYDTGNSSLNLIFTLKFTTITNIYH
jgi:hypothetical protein